MNKVLIVEDEVKIAELLRDYLLNSQFECHLEHHGGHVMDAFKKQKPDIVLLDIMLPEIDGITLCKEIRKISQVPIIFITAKVEEIDRILGLELGADDYICKPFSPREVVVRVKNILKRVEILPANEPVTAEIILNKNTMRAEKGGQGIELTNVEFQLLQLLFSEPGKIFSRTKIMEAMYEDHRIVSDRTIDSHVKKLRKKITQIEPDKDIIHSVYGVGYKYEPEL